MGRINATLDDKFEQEFRAEVSKRIGFKKGNLQLAVQEALRDWMEKGKKTSGSKGSKV